MYLWNALIWIAYPLIRTVQPYPRSKGGGVI